MRPLHGLTTLLISLSFFLFCIPASSQDTIHHFAKLGDTTTLNFPGQPVMMDTMYRWLVPPQGEIFDVGTTPSLFIPELDTMAAGIYELQRAQVGAPDEDYVTVGFVEVDPLCVSPPGESPSGCFSCREILVNYKNPDPDKRMIVEDFFATHNIFPAESCRCDSIVLYRLDSYNVSGINIEEIADNGEDMVEVEDADFGLNFVITTGPALDTFLVDIIADTIMTDTLPTNDCVDGKADVAVIDAGIQRNHVHYGFPQNYMFWNNPDESVNGMDDDDNWYIDDIVGFDFLNDVGGDFLQVDGHGTHVAGIIFANPPAGNGDLVNIMDLKFYEPNEATLFDAVCAIYYGIDKEADVMNLSWGYNHYEPSRLLYTALADADTANIIVVASAGNEKQNNDLDPHWPSNYTVDFSNMVAVAALSKTTPLGLDYSFASEYSNFGPTTVDFAAPGTFIQSTYPVDIMEVKSGTSMAAAYVSRLAAHARICKPGISDSTVVDCFEYGSMVPLEGADGLFIDNKGRIDYNAVMGCILTVGVNEPLPQTGLNVYPIPFTEQFTIDLSTFTFQQGSFMLFHTSGQLVATRQVTAGAKQELSFGNLSPGVYFYLLRLEEGLFSGKIIRQ